MIQNLLIEHGPFLAALLSPALFAIAAMISWFQPGGRPRGVIIASKVAAVIGIIAAAACGWWVYHGQLLVSPGIDYKGMGISLRLDALSVLIFSMINLIAFIVLRFSFNYLDGDDRQGVFTGRLAATVAAVQLLVLSGNIGLLWLTWVLTSFQLHRLLRFYPDRKRAVIAARKKFIAARLSDAFLLGAVYCLYMRFGTGDLEAIITGMKTAEAGTPSLYIEAAAICTALAAILKSALFPTHGWLVEVMETPTPVSALLHAGLLNAGPFLVARLAFVVHGSTFSPVVLILFGGITAVFASVTYLTQTSVKTALGYSSVAHMGFSLMMCGMGMYTAAMLHLVAHSFYKAHAFLSSGSAIDVLKSARVSLPEKRRSATRAAMGVVLSLATFAGLAYVWGITPAESPGFFAVSIMMSMGVALLLATTFDSKGSTEAMLKTVLWAAAVAIAFFTLEGGMSAILGIQVPEPAIPGPAAGALIIAVLLLFAAVAAIQIFGSPISDPALRQKWAIHIRNGLYTNAWFDRLAGALKQKNA